MPLVLKMELLALVLVAGAYDLRFRRIPNWLNLISVVAGFAVNGMLSGGPGLKTAFLGFALALLVYVPLYLVRAMGAGDVKLMAAVGAMAGPRHWLEIFLVTAIFGGIASLVLIALRKRFHQTLVNLAVIGAELLHFRVPAHSDERLDMRSPEGLHLPHAVVIASGCIAFILFTIGG